MGNLKILGPIYIIAAIVRYGLIHSNFRKEIENRIEVTTPINAYARVAESVYRMEIGVDPYSSDLLHETPIHLFIYKLLMDNFQDYMYLVYIISDILTAHFLYLFTKRYMLHVFMEHVKNKNKYMESYSRLLVKGREYLIPPIAVAVVYLFNPYSIINCIAFTTTVFYNLQLSLFYVGLVYGNMYLGVLSLVACTGQSFYAATLVSPLFLAIKLKKSLKFACLTVLAFVASLFMFLSICSQLQGGWDFLKYTYGFVWYVKDQQPNIGVFWYFFMEMFEHFRSLFIFSFQINVLLLYFIPLSIKFRSDPILLATCFTTIIAIFQSYPNIGNVAFILGLLPCWKHLYSCMQQIFISGVTIIVTTVLAPILWDLWISWGSGNANFYFGISLAFVTAQIFVLTDIAFAYTKREYLLMNGKECRKHGQNAKLILQ